MNKRELRKLFLQKRIDLTLTQVADLTTAILKNFRNVITTQPRNLLSYSPLAETNEFNVGLCENILSEVSRDMRVFWPKISSYTVSMEAHLVDKTKSFIKNQFQILEPINGDVIPPVLIDMVFVPLLAFDENGYRVGYGKGFYDRYLSQCRPDVLKVGFSFFDPVPPISDIDEFDVPLNHCITPTRIYEF